MTLPVGYHLGTEPITYRATVEEILRDTGNAQLVTNWTCKHHHRTKDAAYVCADRETTRRHKRYRAELGLNHKPG